MKSKRNLIEQLKILPYFDKKIVSQIGGSYGLKDTTIDTYISRYLKSKEIINLKKGFYVSADFLNKNKSDVSYLFYLANVLRTSSYISSWTALQYYNLVTESIYTIISVTPKITKTYETKAGNFNYQSIKKELFSDFVLIEKNNSSVFRNNFDFYIASPSKALFDLLYFKTHQFRGMSLNEIKVLIVDLRIDIDEMSNEEQLKFYKMINTYLNKK
jgi:predicted transcriptional regulator of viral defense system